MTDKPVPDTIFDNTDHNQKIKQMKNTVESGYINFLFGAGVNGKCFPNFATGFLKTKEKLKQMGKDGENIENDMSSLEGDHFSRVITSLIEEFNSENVKELSDSYENLKNLLAKIHSVVDRNENRQPHTKKVNIFTLNYDRIVENILDNLGYFYNSITATKLIAEPFDVIGYNPSKRKFVPTFAISKLHGSADSNGKIGEETIILPGRGKDDRALSREFFGVLFKMKSELEKRNAVLFVIGYSGADKDVNHILQESAAGGLTVYWLRFSKEDNGVGGLGINPITIEPEVDENGNCLHQDTTKTLLKRLEEVDLQ